MMLIYAYLGGTLALLCIPIAAKKQGIPDGGKVSAAEYLLMALFWPIIMFVAIFNIG